MPRTEVAATGTAALRALARSNISRAGPLCGASRVSSIKHYDDIDSAASYSEPSFTCACQLRLPCSQFCHRSCPKSERTHPSSKSSCIPWASSSPSSTSSRMVAEVPHPTPVAPRPHPFPLQAPLPSRADCLPLRAQVNEGIEAIVQETSAASLTADTADTPPLAPPRPAVADRTAPPPLPHPHSPLPSRYCIQARPTRGRCAPPPCCRDAVMP